MRWALLLLLAGCATSPAIPPPPEGTCTRDAKLPKPPGPSRTIPQLLKWADTAALVANRAIDERDLCAGSYDRLKAWADQVRRGS